MPTVTCPSGEEPAGGGQAGANVGPDGTTADPPVPPVAVAPARAAAVTVVRLADLPAADPATWKARPGSAAEPGKPAGGPALEYPTLAAVGDNRRVVVRGGRLE